MDILFRCTDDVLRPRHGLIAFCWYERLYDLRLRAEAVEDKFRGRFSVELTRGFRVQVELAQVAIEFFIGLGGRFALASGFKGARFMVCDAKPAILAAKSKVDDAAERMSANGKLHGLFYGDDLPGGNEWMLQVSDALLEVIPHDLRAGRIPRGDLAEKFREKARS